MCRGHPVSCVADKAAGLMGLPNRAGIEIDSQKNAFILVSGVCEATHIVGPPHFSPLNNGR